MEGLFFVIFVRDNGLEREARGWGQGSEFNIVLPKSLIINTPAPALNILSEAESALVSRRILLVDDNRDAAETLGMLLKLSGHEVHIAHTGQEAFEIGKQLRPGLGILDIGLPDCTGYDLAKRIRHQAWGKQIKLIAVTGWGQADDKRRALAAGFDHHLTKPVDATELEQLFND